MIRTKSARDILIESEIRNKLKECFKKCAQGRIQLKKCVIRVINAGLSQDRVFKVINDMSTKGKQDEASLCAIVAIGQMMRLKQKTKVNQILPTAKIDKLENQLKTSFKKCGLARSHMRKCVIDSLDAGFSMEEILAITDDIVGGFGRNEVSICAIIAVDQVLRYEMNARADPIDIVKERKLERE